MIEEIFTVDRMLREFYGEDVIPALCRDRMLQFLERDFLTVTPEIAARDLAQANRVLPKQMMSVVDALKYFYDDHADVMPNPIRSSDIRRFANRILSGNRRPFDCSDWKWFYDLTMAHTNRNEKAFYLFIALTGFRRVDAALLHPTHWFPEDGTVRKRFAKSKCIANIPLGRVARGIVEQRIADAPTGEPTIVFATKRFTSVPPNTHFYRYLLTTREDMEFGTMAMREAWKEVGKSLGLSKYQIAQIAGDNVPIPHDIVAVDQRRIWMQAIEDRIIELATTGYGQVMPQAA